MNIITTEELQFVENGVKSILPTGRLKIEDGQLSQEIMLFIHKTTPEKEAGLYKEWILVYQDFIDAIKAL